MLVGPPEGDVFATATRLVGVPSDTVDDLVKSLSEQYGTPVTRSQSRAGEVVQVRMHSSKMWSRSIRLAQRFANQVEKSHMLFEGGELLLLAKFKPDANPRAVVEALNGQPDESLMASLRDAVDVSPWHGLDALI